MVRVSRSPLAATRSPKQNARLVAARSSQQDDPSTETLRLALQRERGSFSNWSTEARPFARSPWFGSEVGAILKGLDRPVELTKSSRMKKGRYAPRVAVTDAETVLLAHPIATFS